MKTIIHKLILSFSVLFLAIYAHAQDTNPPLVFSTVPEMGEVAVELNTAISVTYMEPVTFVSGSATINGNIALTSLSGNTLTIVPPDPLVAGTVYVISLPAGIVKDAADNLSVPFGFSFTTTIPPALSCNPTSLNFSTDIGTSQQNSFTLIGTGFSSLYSLLSVDATLSGPNSDQFGVDPITLSTLLPALLGGESGCKCDLSSYGNRNTYSNTESFC